MKKTAALLSALALAAASLFAAAPAHANELIISPLYPQSVTWDQPCYTDNISATRAADTADVTYTEEDHVTFPDGTVRWVQYAHLVDHGNSWVQPLPAGYTRDDLYTAEVSYLDTYCG